MLRVTPIYGSRFDSISAKQPSCTLVEYGGVKVLWNVGYNTDFPELPDHDCLVLSDSTLHSMGALPLYCQQFPHSSVYTTFPSVKMGQMTLYDHHAALCLDGQKPPYSLEQIDNAFANLQTIKYAQSLTIGNVLTVTAHRAGHVVGGAFFVLQKLQDETVVVLTYDYNIAKELHLDSAELLKYGTTPDVLVTYPGGSCMRMLMDGSSSKTVSQSQKQLMDTILAVLRRDGNVLLPADASGRVLELILLLHQHWDRSRLVGTYNLCWLGPMVENTIDYAKSQLEWMNKRLGTQFDSLKHPYNLEHVEVFTSMSQLERFWVSNKNPSCVVASGLTLDCGPARDLLLKWADNPDNAIVMTDSSHCHIRSSTVTPPPSDPAAVTAEDLDEDDIVGSAISGDESKLSVSAQLLQKYAQAKSEGREMDDSVEIDVRVPQRRPLVGAELKAFLASEEAARQQQKQMEEKRAMLREVELAKGQLRLGEEEAATDKSFRVDTTKRPKKKSRFDSTLFLKFSKPMHLMFEFREEAVGIGQSDSTAKYGIGESVGRSGEVLEDEYGIAVIPERFVDIVTGVDPSKFAGKSGRIGDEVLRRGFGFGVDTGNRARLGGKQGITAEGVPGGEEDGGDEEDTDEQFKEAIDLSEGTGIIRGRGGRPPTKVTTAPRRLEVLAEVTYVPLEGRVDSRAARQSVRALQPRQVVVLGGAAPAGSDEADEVTMLADAAQSFTTTNNPVQKPSDGETAELNVGHAAYSVRLVDTPYRSREERERDADHVPEPVEPFEAKLGACSVGLLDCVATGQKVAADGSIVLAPRSSAAENRPTLYISDGDVLLTDLRSELIAQGMKAEYSAHAGYSQLVVNGKIVVVKEQETGKIDVEGPLCEDFFSVRSAVCGQYITL